MTSFSDAYSSAYALYEAGKYKEATLVFTDLCAKNPFEKPCWKGLASSSQMLGDYEKALSAWSVCVLMDEKDAWSHFHAAECLLSMQQVEDAKKALNKALERARKDENTELEGKILVLQEIYK